MAGFRLRATSLVLAMGSTMLVLSSYLAYQNRQDGLAHAIERVTATAELIVAEQRGNLTYAEQLLDFLAASADIGALMAEPGCSRHLAQQAKPGSRFAIIAIISGTGDLVCSDPPLSVPINVADLSYFRAASKASGLIVGEAAVGRASGKFGLPVAKAIRDRDGRFLGVSLAALDLDWVGRHLASGLDSSNARLGLISAQGMVLARAPDPEGAVGEDYSATAFFRTLTSMRGRGTAETIGFDNVPRIYSFVPFAQTTGGEITLWVGVSKGFAMGRANAQFAWTLVIIVFLTGLISALTWIGGDRLLVRPLTAIGDFARRIGQGDATAKTGLPHDKGEIGRVASALDGMADALGSTNRLMHINRALRVISAVNEALIRAQSEQELLDSMCRAVGEAGKFRMAWVGYAQEDPEKSVQLVGQWGASADYLASLKVSWGDDERGDGPTGIAIRTGKPSAMRFALTDPTYEPFREAARRWGYGSSIALPLEIDGRTIGALNLYASEADVFDDEEVQLLMGAAADVAFGIATQRTALQRKLAEHAARQALADLQEAQHIAGLGSWRLDCASGEVTWSAQIFRMFGMAPEGPPPSFAEQRLFTPESFARLGDALRRSRRDGISYDLDLETVLADGSNGWMFMHGQAMRDDKGQIIAVRGIALDITGRKRAELALAESQAEFRALTENSSDLTLVLDAAGVVRFASPSLERVAGYEPAEIVGRNIAEFLHPDDIGAAVADIAKIIGEPHDPRAAELRYRHKEGHWICLASVSSNALQDPAVRGIVVNARDVTERQRAEEADRASRKMLQSVVDNVPIRVFWKDRDLRYVGCNSLFARDAGCGRPVDLIGKDDFEMPWRDQAEVYRVDDRRVIDSDTPKLGYEEPQTTPDGRSIWLRTSKVPLHDADGSVFGMLGIYDDVTEIRHAQDRIRRLNRVYAVLSGINSAIVRIRDPLELFREASHIAVKDGGFVMAWAGRVDREAGVVRPEGWAGDDVRSFLDVAPLAMLETLPGGVGLVGQAVIEMKPMMSNDVLNEPQRLVKKELAERGVKSLAVLPLIHGDEAMGVLAFYAAEVDVFDNEEIRLLVELARDVSFALDYMVKAEQASYLAYYDVMTGLPNRTLARDRLVQYLTHAASQGESAALALMDVQRFRNVNETLGRRAGDVVLKEVGRRLAASVGEDSSPAYIGADVFAFVAKHVSGAREAMEVASRTLAACFDVPIVVDGNELRLAGRMGIALFPADAADADGLLRGAEAALANAKKDGMDCRFYSAAMMAGVAQKLGLESKLRRAIEGKEFVLHYQPKFDARTGRITSMEALIRLPTAEGTLMPPGEFIPLLEETGLILSVGEWVMQEAVRQRAAWNSAGLPAPRIAVNVSALQLRSEDFVAVLRRAIAGTADHGLDLEITESLIMTDVDDNIEKLLAAKALGVRVFVDDFGTGYSSLRYIAKLPIDALKIDRSFVVNMSDRSEDMSIVSSIISLAHDLGLLVVAEGVESEDQAKVLRLLNCDELQGFLFGRAVPPSEVPALLRGAAVST